MHPTRVDNDLLAQTPAAARQSDEAELRAQVVVSAEAGTAFIADEGRLNDDVVSDGQTADAFPEFLDSAGEAPAP